MGCVNERRDVHVVCFRIYMETPGEVSKRFRTDKLNVMGTRSLTKWIAESHRSELVTFGTKEVGSHRRPPQKKKKKKKVE